MSGGPDVATEDLSDEEVVMVYDAPSDAKAAKLASLIGELEKSLPPRKTVDAPQPLYDLPPTPSALTVDPRTNLPILDLPKDFPAKEFAGEPLVHYVEVVDKMHHTRKFDKRWLVVTNYCVYLIHLNGKLGRCVEVAQIASVLHSHDYLGLIIPKEFDIVIRGDEPLIERCISVLRALYTFKLNRPLEVVPQELASTLMENVKVDKPKSYKDEMKRLHSKQELYSRLHLINAGHQSFIGLNKDPRTGLCFVDIPKDEQPLFRNGPFAHKETEKPVLHFYSPVLKVDHRLRDCKRLLLVTNSAVYLVYPNGAIQRCIPIVDIKAIADKSDSVGLWLGDLDVLVKFRPGSDDADRLVHVLSVLYKFKTARDLQLHYETELLELRKPAGYRAGKGECVVTRTDLAEHLLSLGISPDDPPLVP